MFPAGFFGVLGLRLLAGSPSGGFLGEAQLQPIKHGGAILLINYFSRNQEGKLNDKKNYIFMLVPPRRVQTDEWVNERGGSQRESQTSKYTHWLPVPRRWGAGTPASAGRRC